MIHFVTIFHFIFYFTNLTSAFIIDLLNWHSNFSLFFIAVYLYFERIKWAGFDKQQKALKIVVRVDDFIQAGL